MAGGIGSAKSWSCRQLGDVVAGWFRNSSLKEQYMLLPLSHPSSSPRSHASHLVPAGAGTHWMLTAASALPLSFSSRHHSQIDFIICLVPRPSEEKLKSSVMAFSHLCLPRLISDTTHLGQLLLALFCDDRTHVPAPGPLHWLFSLGASSPQVPPSSVLHEGSSLDSLPSFRTSMLIARSAHILLSNPCCAERTHGFLEKRLLLRLGREIGRM